VIRGAVLVQGNRPTAPSPTFAGVRAWIDLGMLWFVYVLNFLDRQLLAILAKPIKDSLHVSDRQLGLIGGLYFAVFYCIRMARVSNGNSRRLPIHSLLFALSK
jgi:sugar phosphate permease